ncbi:MAG: glycosyltransferase family 4 protein [Phycisphaeraceae bacterium]
MRIAYLTGEYPRATDTFIQREVAALRELGVDVRTFAIRRPASSESTGREQEAERARTSYLLPARVGELLAAHAALLCRRPKRYAEALTLAWRTAPEGVVNHAYQLFYFAEAALLARRLERAGISHVHNHFANSSCSVAMLAGHLAGLPFSFTLHGPAIFYEPRRWRLDEKTSRARFVACISWFCRSQAMLFAARKDWPKLHVVHCGVDLALFAARRHDGPGGRVLFVGRLAAVKGVAVLLEAMAEVVRQCPQAELTLVGDGADRGELERLAGELGVAAHVRFVGYRSPSEVRALLEASDLFVLPSFAEGVPVVLMEAMAAGVPVVATRVAGVSELVEDGVAGRLVHPGDSEALTRAMAALLNDAALRQRMGDAGRAAVRQEFDVRREAHRLRLLFEASGRGESPAVRPITGDEQANAVVCDVA